MPAQGRFDSVAVPPALVGASDRFAFSRDAVRALDRAAIDDFRVPGVVLMENAAIGLAHVAHEMLQIMRADAALILAGPGNNGGDGFALARHLAALNIRTSIAIMTDLASNRGDAAVNLNIIRAMRLPITNIKPGGADQSLDIARRELGACCLFIDAMLGTGATSPPRPPISDAIAWLNRVRASQPESAVLAVDLPSGIDCDTGAPIGAGDPTAVVADATATLAGLKTGMLDPRSRRYTGRILTLSIGAPPELIRRFATPISPAAGA